MPPQTRVINQWFNVDGAKWNLVQCVCVWRLTQKWRQLVSTSCLHRRSTTTQVLSLPTVQLSMQFRTPNPTLITVLSCTIIRDRPTFINCSILPWKLPSASAVTLFSVSAMVSSCTCLMVRFSTFVTLSNKNNNADNRQFFLVFIHTLFSS